MINPQLMGLQNFDNVPTTNDLWKNEKQKYRHWMILFGIGLLLVFVFYSISVVLNWFDKDNIIADLIKRYEEAGHKDPRMLAQNQWITNFVVFPSIIMSLLFVGLVLYIVTIVKSYLQHSFARVSLWSIYIVGFGALFSFIQIITNLSSVGLGLRSVGSIFGFITLLLFIIVYFTTATKVNRIRKQFAYSEYIQKLKSDERFMQFQQNLQNSMNNPNLNQPVSPFSPSVLNPTPQIANNQKPITNDTKNPSDIKMHKQYNKLKAMSLPKLKEIAEKLSISGFELMQKDEIIETIIRVSKQE